MTKKKKKKQSKLVSTTKTLVTSGTLNVMGSHLVGQMPSTAATSGVQSGFTTMGRMYAPIATASAMGIVTSNLKKLNTKKRKRRK